MKNRIHLVLLSMPLLALALAPGACSSKDDGGGDGGKGGGAAGANGEGGGGDAGKGGTNNKGGSGGTSASGGTTASGGAGGGSGGSSGGSGGTGTGGAGTGGAATGGTGGTAATKTAVATIAGIEGGTITGTATFTLEGTSVKVVYDVSNCPTGSHSTHIHAGTGCGDRDKQGMHWDGTRGEGIPNLSCGADKKGTLTYTRTAAVAGTKWTLGDGSATDIVGHPLIVHGINASDRHGCGVITLSK